MRWDQGFNWKPAVPLLNGADDDEENETDDRRYAEGHRIALEALRKQAGRSGSALRGPSQPGIAVGVPALVHLGFGQATAAAPANETIAEVQALKASVAQLATDLGALRTGVDQSSKLTTAHFGKVTDRLDRAERAQAEPAAKLSRLGQGRSPANSAQTAPQNRSSRCRTRTSPFPGIPARDGT
jgi:hypothetical protein